MQNSTLLPKPFKGNAIALITAGLMAMAFMAFNGMIV
jgi:electron transport complex protein RnfA